MTSFYFTRNSLSLSLSDAIHSTLTNDPDLFPALLKISTKCNYWPKHSSYTFLVQEFPLILTKQPHQHTSTISPTQLPTPNTLDPAPTSHKPNSSMNSPFQHKANITHLLHSTIPTNLQKIISVNK
eukprot:Phypoly_transcript_02178.p1 GENE.Phypoly_transcript_02178~~Phypoly_transcript_02178.p1  ORF type:complete len:126 (-),score=21.31 Phypoly_transcript_02178:529-906(-)